MGKLRLISKKFRPDSKEYRKYWDLLNQARALAVDHLVVWDPDPGEDIAQARRCFLYVAKREGFGLKVRRPRGQDCLRLRFLPAAAPKPLTPDQYQAQILKVLADYARPMKRIEILRAGELSEAVWHKRIQSLVNQGRVVKSGQRINTVYALPELETPG